MLDVEAARAARVAAFREACAAARGEINRRRAVNPAFRLGVAQPDHGVWCESRASHGETRGMRLESVTHPDQCLDGRGRLVVELTARVSHPLEAAPGGRCIPDGRVAVRAVLEFPDTLRTRWEVAMQFEAALPLADRRALARDLGEAMARMAVESYVRHRQAVRPGDARPPAPDAPPTPR